VPIQSDEENKRGQGKAPLSNLGYDQPLAPLRDRQERHARRCRGEFPPLPAMPFLEGLEGHHRQTLSVAAAPELPGPPGTPMARPAAETARALRSIRGLAQSESPERLRFERSTRRLHRIRNGARLILLISHCIDARAQSQCFIQTS
jgi:hypothetical protein